MYFIGVWVCVCVMYIVSVNTHAGGTWQLSFFSVYPYDGHGDWTQIGRFAQQVLYPLIHRVNSNSINIFVSMYLTLSITGSKLYVVSKVSGLTSWILLYRYVWITMFMINTICHIIVCYYLLQQILPAWDTTTSSVLLPKLNNNILMINGYVNFNTDINTSIKINFLRISWWLAILVLNIAHTHISM